MCCCMVPYTDVSAVKSPYNTLPFQSLDGVLCSRTILAGRDVRMDDDEGHRVNFAARSYSRPKVHQHSAWVSSVMHVYGKDGTLTFAVWKQTSLLALTGRSLDGGKLKLTNSVLNEQRPVLYGYTVELY